jgi:crotonobetainyl-CoA:carnitine CoA-transferase CaiB-like acyl-CoA transferase
MLLGDLGADVVAVDEATFPDRRGRRGAIEGDLARMLGALEYMRRNTRRIALDLRHVDGQTVMQQLVAGADVLLEGFRPGVAARLGLDPGTLIEAHPRLIICSISGYGQDGPYRDRAGHDINYLALGGLLGLTGSQDGSPVPPGSLVADLAAGGLPAAVAILGALFGRERTGRGQYVDVSVQEGVAALTSPMLGLLQAGFPVSRGASHLTGAAPWYGVYATADGRFLAVGAIEPWFWAELCRRIDQPDWSARQFDTDAWPAMRAELADIFRSQPLAIWLERFGDADVCITPVLEPAEVFDDPQLAARGSFATVPDASGNPVRHIRALPTMSGAPADSRRPPSARGADAQAILADLGFTPTTVRRLLAGGGIGPAPSYARPAAGRESS